MVDRSEEPPDAGGWDFIGKWKQFAQPFTEMAGEDVWPMWGSRTALQTLFEAVSSRLVGKSIKMGDGENRVGLTLSSIEADLRPVPTAAGQTDDVTFTAENLEWRSLRFPEVTATLRNVHTRFGARPALVCAPVDVRVKVTSEALNSVLGDRHPWVGLDISDDGKLIACLARHPRWGSVELRPSVERGSVVVRATGLMWAARSWRFKRRIPSVSLNIGLPVVVRVTDVEGRANHLHVSLRVDEWKLDYLELMSMAKKSSSSS